MKCPEVSKSPPKMWLTLDLVALTNTKPMLVPAGETGLLVSKIGEKAPFTGYAKNKQQTEKKKLRDVFVKGDLYFNSGDLLKIDNEGFVFFQDRIGDTFRSVEAEIIETDSPDLETNVLSTDFCTLLLYCTVI